MAYAAYIRTTIFFSVSPGASERQAPLKPPPLIGLGFVLLVFPNQGVVGSLADKKLL